MRRMIQYDPVARPNSLYDCCFYRFEIKSGPGLPLLVQFLIHINGGSNSFINFKYIHIYVCILLVITWESWLINFTN